MEPWNLFSENFVDSYPRNLSSTKFKFRKIKAIYSMCLKEWYAKKNKRLPTPQCPRHQGYTPHPVTLPPSQIDPSREEENHLGWMEQLPQCTPSPQRQTSHYLHHSLGPLQVPHSPTRLCCLRWRIHWEIWWNHLIHSKQDKVHGWHPLFVRHNRRKLLPGS